MNALQQKALKLMILPRLGSNPTTSVVAGFVGDEVSLRMPVTSIVSQVAEWIIDQALAQDSPTMLIHIIHKVDDESQRMASLIDIAAELAAHPERWPDHNPVAAVDWSVEGDPLQISDGRPFVDRSTFRGLIPRLGADPTPACTVVKGQDGDGKTYLHEFCKKLAGHWGRKQPGLLRVGFSECVPNMVAGLTPDIPAFEVATGLGLDFLQAPRPHEDEHRWGRNLASWITAKTPAGALPAVAIFDGYDRSGLPRPIHTFIEELVRGVQQDPVAKARLRIMLLGYDQGRLEQQELEFESCVLEHVGAADIERWFRRRFPDQPAYRYEETAEMIADRLPDNGPLRMRLLCLLMQAATSGFEGSG